MVRDMMKAFQLYGDEHWKKLVNEGIEARQRQDGAQWDLGDLALKVEKRYGKDTLGKYADEIGVDENTLEWYRYVSSKYQKLDRSNFSLSWTHFKVVASREDRLDWLKKAEKEGWSVRRLEEEVKKVSKPKNPPMPKGEFDVIYADPPWQYEVDYLQCSPNKHYSTMTTEEICKTEIPASKNAVLFLWATNPMLEDALTVMKAWGFKYKTNLCWIKKDQDVDQFSVGFWFRGQHELLLVGTKGEVMPPDEHNRFPSVIEAPRTEHSKKPDKVYEIIEKMFPNLKKIELFARKEREGWKPWGLEVKNEV